MVVALRRTTDAEGLGAAMICAAAMIAQQVAAKAARDALFLARFEATLLPFMLVGAALGSIVFVVAASRAMARLGPARLVPLAFVASGALLLAEWALAGRSPGAMAVAFYLHVACFGSVLVSGFWSLIGEQFDPRAAKRRIGWIAGAGTLGGLAGGLAVERLAGRLEAVTLLPGLAALQLVCAAALAWPSASTPARRQGGDAASATGAPGPSAGAIVRRDPYLRSLATFVLLSSVAATLADYLFKSWAAAEYPDGKHLLRFFAAFYTVTSLLAFVLQVGLGRRALQALGLARTAALLPLSVLLGGVGSLLVPGLGGATALRGTEAVLRGSLYRLAYELLYGPLPAAEKRATKTLVDVAVDRLGEVAGAVLVRMALLAVPQAAAAVVSGLAVVAAAAGLAIARRLHLGYVQALERGLLARAVALDVSVAVDRPTAAFPVLGAADALDTGLFLFDVTAPPPPAESPGKAAAEPAHAPVPRDDVVTRLVALRSGDASRVRRVLREAALDGVHVAQAIRLLAWDEVEADARHALQGMAPRITGQLVDTLLDDTEEFTIRRRIPRILAGSPTAAVVDGLIRGLADRRFEVRYQCGQALARLHEETPDLAVPEQAVLAAVLREAAADRAVWEGHRLLDGSPEDAAGIAVRDYVRIRGARSLEHVFTVLSLVLPRQPLQVAFRGLQTDDPHLRGIALEYLESVLPAGVRVALWPFLEDDRRQPAGTRSRQELVQELLRLDSSIDSRLAALRAGAVDGDGGTT
jgi:ATP:ADP antiporter, AAA family